MDSPRYTVIAPMARYQADEPVLASLRETPAPPGGLQIIVAEGGHPARQRNLALGRAVGEVVVFLDNDCTLGAGFWAELDRVFAGPGVEIAGGPARLRPDATFWRRSFTRCSRTRSSSAPWPRATNRGGKFRPATQTDLILCNLAVRRRIFARIGPLSSELYPNEENEWLDRAHAAGVGAYYDPALQVFRPQRRTPGAMALTLLRYGMGRTRQFRVSGWRPTFHQGLPFLLVATLAAIVLLRLEAVFVALWLLASAIVAATCPRPLGLGAADRRRPARAAGPAHLRRGPALRLVRALAPWAVECVGADHAAQRARGGALAVVSPQGVAGAGPAPVRPAFSGTDF
ncbi:MAG: glycosyltransferase [Verrucomicrobiota bacterium]